MHRKKYFQLSSFGSAGLSLSLVPCCNSCSDNVTQEHSLAFKKLTQDLLKYWCDGMISVQVIEPEMLDSWNHLPEINTSAPLPRYTEDGIKHFSDLDTTLFARGDWRGTVTVYDAIYKDEHYRLATSRALSVLYHNRVAPFCAASMVVYKLVEPNNQQPNPGKDFAFTPRVETFKNDVWYSNIFDREAILNSEDSNGKIQVLAKAQLKNESNEVLTETASDFEISYTCSKDKLRITTKTAQPVGEPTAFVLPIISPTGEKVTQPEPNEITIQKPEGLVSIKANVPLKIKDIAKERIFNMVPGAEAVPLWSIFRKKTTK